LHANSPGPEKQNLFDINTIFYLPDNLPEIFCTIDYILSMRKYCKRTNSPASSCSRNQMATQILSVLACLFPTVGYVRVLLGKIALAMDF
jgi:hypothetical protein